MSTEYFGVRTADQTRIGELVENRTPPADIPPIDVEAMRTLLERAWVKGAPGEPMRFEKNGSQVTVYISAASVQLAHTNSGDFDDIMDVVMEVQMTMTGAGLNVWDPQQGSWFPGSPVLEETEANPTK